MNGRIEVDNGIIQFMIKDHVRIFPFSIDLNEPYQKFPEEKIGNAVHLIVDSADQ